MIEVAKEFMELIKHAPQYTLWVLIGILFYKVFIIGSWIAIARLLIHKTYDVIMRGKEPKQVNIKSILCEVDEELVKSTLLSVPRENLSYFHASHLKWLDTAIKEKIERDKK